MAKTKEPSASATPAHCPSCERRLSCFAHGADTGALEQLDAAVERRLRLEGNEYLYRTGDPFRSLYALRSGCLMNSIRDAKGEEQVMGFHLPGDVVGVGGIGHATYIFDMRALEPSEVCEVPFERLQELATRVPALSKNILRIFGRYRDRDARTQSLRREDAPETRVAGFLLDFSRRLEERGSDPAKFRLPISRADIASYLGLRSADVEVELTRLNRRGTVAVSEQAMEIKDLPALQSLAAGRG